MLTTPGTRPGRTSLRAIRLFVVTAVGGLLLVAGLAALVLPGPGTLLCILGLIVLASEYAWAQRSLHWVRGKSRQNIERSASSRVATYASVAAGAGLFGVGLVELAVGLPLLTSLSAAMLIASGLVVIGTTSWSRHQHLRARRYEGRPPAHVGTAQPPDGHATAAYGAELAMDDR